MLLRILPIFLTAAFVCGCQRQPREVLEDSKTASHHVGKAFSSLGGKRGRSRQVANREAFGLPDSAFDSHDQGLSSDVPTFELSERDFDQTYRQTNPTPGDDESSLPGIEAFTSPKGELASIIMPIYFDTDQDRPRQQSDRDRIIKIAQYLKSHPRTYLYIEGHCDERGTAAYNLSLGSRRSNSVRKRLIDLKVPANQLFTISYGKERPEISGHGESAWRGNRRAQFKLLER